MTTFKIRERLYRSKIFRSMHRILPTQSQTNQAPIFIVGTIRSGSTLLAKCLGKHPEIIYPERELSREWCDFGNIEIARTKLNKTQCPPYGILDATQTRCQWVRHGFAELHKLHGGSQNTRLLDKNPHAWNKLPFMGKIFPEANIIITSRDIRSTVASTKVLWIKQHKQLGTNYYFPGSSEYCWTVIPPTQPNETDSSRIFPGGDIAVLAQYWLNTYEMIERSIDIFGKPVVVKHREFLTNPYDKLSTIFVGLGISLFRYKLPVKLDLSRNDHWQAILTDKEQDRLQSFIEQNYLRIKQLKYADTTL